MTQQIDPTPASASPSRSISNNAGPTDPRVFIGWDTKEMMGHVIASTSMQYTATRRVNIRRLSMLEQQMSGNYTRKTEIRNGQLFDVISDAPMSTEHALTRFLVPYLCDYKGWALFTDGDILVRDDITQLFALADPAFALMCVKHPSYLQQSTAPKKDGMVQQPYPRKNWSSVMLFNCAHLANRSLNPRMINSAKGRDLHRFFWLADHEIGALPARWNWLVGVNEEIELGSNTAIAHFTLGTPNLPGSIPSVWDLEWWAMAKACGYTMSRPLMSPADGYMSDLGGVVAGV